MHGGSNAFQVEIAGAFWICRSGAEEVEVGDKSRKKAKSREEHKTMLLRKLEAEYMPIFYEVESAGGVFRLLRGVLRKVEADIGKIRPWVVSTSISILFNFHTAFYDLIIMLFTAVSYGFSRSPV